MKRRGLPLRKSKRILLVCPQEKIIGGLNRDLQGPIEIQDAEEKGKGVFATEDIPSRMYICEYKTTNVYKTAEFIPKQREYEINHETSATISFKVGQTKLLL